MLEWIIVGSIIAVAVLLLSRSVYRAVNAAKPTCACGHVDCPLVGECVHGASDDAHTLPPGCPLDATGSGEQNPVSVKR